MLSGVPTQLPLTLKAYVLSKENVNSLQQWHPAKHVVTEAVSGGEVHETVLCTEGQGEAAGGVGVPGLDGEPVGLLGGVADFVFKGQPSVSALRLSMCHASICIQQLGFVQPLAGCGSALTP